MNKLFLLPILITLAVTVSLPASAALTSTGPFTGTISETWESFNNNIVGPHFLNNPTTIMGGSATISSNAMMVYEPVSAGFGLGFYGDAPVSDGTKGMGLDAHNQTATITAKNLWTSFGAYWGAAYDLSNDPTIYVTAYDKSDNVIGTDSFYYGLGPFGGGGRLEWHGWTSNVNIAKVTYSGDYVAIDGLQANTTTVPEPSSLIAVGFPVLMLGLSKLRRLRK